MTCPRCGKADSYGVRFHFKTPTETLWLDARCCKVCEYLWADEAEHLELIRNHMKAMTQPTEDKPKEKKKAWPQKTSTKFKALPRKKGTRTYSTNHNG